MICFGSILVQHHHCDGGRWVVNVERVANGGCAALLGGDEVAGDHGEEVVGVVINDPSSSFWSSLVGFENQSFSTQMHQ